MERRMWRTAGLVAVCLAGSILLFAPIVGRGECLDSSDPALSVCRTWQTSVLGLETNVWVWLIGTAVVTVATVGIAHARRVTRS